ncbi:hypothetical protein [Aquimarina muelleri]|uniref:Uncharacterized protein n=1 Tax=Aquimarina muelleri TaxID=279356 RepID=A0A918JXC6_9FLAO|nr:hypothetical protein [Aquimarina muelleri]MCX2762912.1 hypothetical protein [Aquimarina muelleri]GGX27216.1 hypothetical protein GCM10007384_30650 [Aquimarina muelleri]
MVTFLIILAGLVAFNFILLKLSTQSVDSDKRKTRKEENKINTIDDKPVDKSKSSKIPNAA